MTAAALIPLIDNEKAMASNRLQTLTYYGSGHSVF